VNGQIEHYESFAIESESLHDTQEQNELWTTDNVPLPSPYGTPTIEEPYICYGTVGH
jgi:hypothetical protein